MLFRSLERLQDEYARRYGPYPAGASWVPARLGGSAPTLEEANALDEAEHAERMRRRAEKDGRPGGAVSDEGTAPQSGPPRETDDGDPMTGGPNTP